MAVPNWVWNSAITHAWNSSAGAPSGWCFNILEATNTIKTNTVLTIRFWIGAQPLSHQCTQAVLVKCLTILQTQTLKRSEADQQNIPVLHRLRAGCSLFFFLSFYCKSCQWSQGLSNEYYKNTVRWPQLPCRAWLVVDLRKECCVLHGNHPAVLQDSQFPSRPRYSSWAYKTN